MSSLFVDNDGKWDWKKFSYRAKSAFAVLLSLAVLIGGGWFGYSKASDAWYEWRTAEDYIGDGGEPIEVRIPKGATVTQMGDILTEEGVVRSTKAFRQAALATDASKIQAGRYRLKKELPAEKALAMLLDKANIIRIRLTFPEGWRLSRQWARIAEQTPLSVKQLQTDMDNPDTLASLGLPAYANNKAEGFMFPETYIVDDDITPAALFKQQVAQYNKVAAELNFDARAEELKLTPYQALTIASLIEAEVHKPEYQPMVARVIFNRLAADMPLQFDSTVHYALDKSGKVTTSDEDRKVDSPYNTYKVKGLTPTPINNPGRTAMNAALSPADGTWLYFVTVDLDTGETKFATTFEEHQANVAQFQAWCQAHTGRC